MSEKNNDDNNCIQIEKLKTNFLVEYVDPCVMKRMRAAEAGSMKPWLK